MNRNRRMNLNLEKLYFDRENEVRSHKKHFEKIKDSEVELEDALTKLEKEELDTAVKIIEIFQDSNLSDLFLKDREITAATDLKKVCIESKKKTMEIIANKYKEKAIKEEFIFPEVELHKLINMVENYYDSFYVRNSKDHDIDYLLPTNKMDIDKIKSKVYKEIKSKVGREGIQNDFAKKKNISFPKYCIEKTNKFVKTLNKEIKDYCVRNDVELTKKFPYTKDLNKANLAKVRVTVPTYLNLLTESYNSRSKLERFFSYFPFINKEAKEERNAIAKIKDIVKKWCLVQFDDRKIKTYMEETKRDIDKDYYKKRIDKLPVFEEKENVIIGEFDNDKVVQLVQNVDDEQLEDKIEKSNLLV